MFHRVDGTMDAARGPTQLDSLETSIVNSQYHDTQRACPDLRGEGNRVLM